MTTLILLPGMDGTGEMFAPLVRELAMQDTTLSIRVISYPKEIPLGYTELCRIAIQQLQSLLPTEPVVFLGESFSGPIATRLATQFKERCHGLILCVSFVHSTIRMPRLTRTISHLIPFDSMSRWPNHKTLGTPPAELQNVLNDILHTIPGAVWRARFQAALTCDERGHLRHLHCPSLYLRALHDRIVPRRTADELVRIQPTMRIIDYNSTHLLLQNHAHMAARDILAFIHTL